MDKQYTGRLDLFRQVAERAVAPAHRAEAVEGRLRRREVRDSWVTIVTRLWTGKSTNGVSIPCGDKNCFSTFNVQPCLSSNAYGRGFLRPTCEAYLQVAPRLVQGAMFLLHSLHTPSRHVASKTACMYMYLHTRISQAHSLVSSVTHVGNRRGPGCITWHDLWLVCDCVSRFFPSTSVSPCQNHFINAPYWFTHLSPALGKLSNWQRR